MYKEWHKRAIDLYVEQSLSAHKTFLTLQSEGHVLSPTTLRNYLKEAGVHRHSLRPGGWKTNKWPIKNCEHCHQDYQPVSRTQRWCKTCCPTYKDGCRMAAYGINKIDYDALLTRSGGKCEICRRVVSKLCVDHDHQTKRVRGLLCDVCNRMLGVYETMPAGWATNADAYLAAS